MFEGCGEGVSLTNPALTLRLYYLPFRGPVVGGGERARVPHNAPVSTRGTYREGRGPVRYGQLVAP